MNDIQKDEQPVLVVTNKEGKLIEVGQPDCFTTKRLATYAKKGYTIKTIPLKEYKATNWKWHWEKDADFEVLPPKEIEQ